MNFSYLRALADSYESIQSVRIEGENRLRAIAQQADETEPVRINIMQRLADMKKIEHDIQGDMLAHLQELPVWTEFLLHIKGIGMTLGAKLLALELSPERNLTSWTAYFGLTTHYWQGTCEQGHKRSYAKDPLVCAVKDRKTEGAEMTVCGCGIVEKEHIEGEAPKRKKGYHSFWNPRARILVYLIGKQFLLGGRFYKEQYYRFKEREQRNRPDISDGRRHNSAMRKTVQLFLAHLYQTMHDLEGTKARIPYQFEYLDHSPDSFINWRDVVKYDSAKKAANE